MRGSWPHGAGRGDCFPQLRAVRFGDVHHQRPAGYRDRPPASAQAATAVCRGRSVGDCRVSWWSWCCCCGIVGAGAGAAARGGGVPGAYALTQPYTFLAWLAHLYGDDAELFALSEAQAAAGCIRAERTVYGADTGRQRGYRRADLGVAGWVQRVLLPVAGVRQALQRAREPARARARR